MLRSAVSNFIGPPFLSHQTILADPAACSGVIREH